jgi:hypothetical protein
MKIGTLKEIETEREIIFNEDNMMRYKEVLRFEVITNIYTLGKRVSKKCVGNKFEVKLCFGIRSETQITKTPNYFQEVIVWRAIK